MGNRSFTRTLTLGPMIGATTDTTALIWARASERGTLQVRLATIKEHLPERPGHVAEGDIDPARDNTVTVQLTGLRPDTRYYYMVYLNDERVHGDLDDLPSFMTFPTRKSKPGSFSFAFGSCFKPWDMKEKDNIFKVLLDHYGKYNPRLFLMIGDNVYADEYYKHAYARNSNGAIVEDLADVYRQAYRQSWKYPYFRTFTGNVPNFMIFDDHEFWDNWGNIPDERADENLFSAACQAYDEFQDVHNPDYEARHALPTPQYYYSFEYGDVGFFVLDCRSLRNPNGLPFKTMLSNQQRVALFKWLRENNQRYKLKFVVSSVPLSFMSIPQWMIRLNHEAMGDQWPGYPEERAEIFRLIRDENITGVHVLSGDIHIGQSMVYEGVDGGPPVYSYTSSPLSNSYQIMPEDFPPSLNAALGALNGAIIGAVLGIWLAFIKDATLPLFIRWLAVMIDGLVYAVIGMLVGAAVGEMIRRTLVRLFPNMMKRFFTWLGEFLYDPFKRLSYISVQSNLNKGKGEKITYRNGEAIYQAKVLVPPVWDINVGIVNVNREGARTTVQIEYYDDDGNLVAKEIEPHEVY